MAAVVAVAAAGSAAFGGGYTIRPGDTVSGLAARFGVTPAAIAAANHLADPDRIYAGHALVIPAGGTAGGPGPGWRGRGSAGGRAGGGRGGSPPATVPAPPGPPLAAVVTPRAGAPLLPVDLVAHPVRLMARPSFRHWAGVYGVPLGLLEAVAWQESGWQPAVVSATGAVGVAQIEPQTGVFISTQLLGRATPLDLLQPDANIRMSAAYLAWLLHQTKGDVADALGGYYQGLADLRARGPLADTRRYVADVGALWGLFRSG